MESLESSDSTEILTISGMCIAVGNGPMRGDLINAGADVQALGRACTAFHRFQFLHLSLSLTNFKNIIPSIPNILPESS